MLQSQQIVNKHFFHFKVSDYVIISDLMWCQRVNDKLSSGMTHLTTSETVTKKNISNTTFFTNQISIGPMCDCVVFVQYTWGGSSRRVVIVRYYKVGGFTQEFKRSITVIILLYAPIGTNVVQQDVNLRICLKSSHLYNRKPWGCHLLVHLDSLVIWFSL